MHRDAGAGVGGPRNSNGASLRPKRVLASKSLSPSRREILACLHQYSALTPRLLAAVYGARAARGGRGYWHIQRQLGQLHAAGLIERRRTARVRVGGGSEEFVYSLTPQGARELLSVAEYSRVRRRLYALGRGRDVNCEHALAVATLQVVLTLGQDGWALREFHRDERGKTPGGEPGQVCPDAVARIESAKGEEQRLVFEIDLARKSDQRIKDRFVGYASYLAGESAYGANHCMRSVVVMVVPAERELERLMRLACEIEPSARIAYELAIWNADDWYEPAGGGRRLRLPRTILSEESLATVTGESRRLVRW